MQVVASNITDEEEAYLREYDPSTGYFSVDSRRIGTTASDEQAQGNTPLLTLRGTQRDRADDLIQDALKVEKVIDMQTTVEDLKPAAHVGVDVIDRDPPPPGSWKAGPHLDEDDIHKQTDDLLADRFPIIETKQPKQTPADTSAGKLPIFGDAVSHMAVGVLPAKSGDSIPVGNPHTDNVTYHTDVVRPVPSGSTDRRGRSVWDRDFINANHNGTFQDTTHKPADYSYDNTLKTVMYSVAGAVLVKALKG